MQRIPVKQEKMFYTQAVADEDVLLVFASRSEFLTRRQIAERLWRKVTPGLIDRIERLCRDNFLQKVEGELPNGRKIFWYARVLG